MLVSYLDHIKHYTFPKKEYNIDPVGALSGLVRSGVVVSGSNLGSCSLDRHVLSSRSLQWYLSIASYRRIRVV